MKYNNIFEQIMYREFYFKNVLHSIKLLRYNNLLKEIITKMNNMNLYIKEFNAPKNMNDYICMKDIFHNITSEIDDVKDILNIIKENFSYLKHNHILNHIEDMISKISEKVIENRLSMALYGTVLLIKESHDIKPHNEAKTLESPLEISGEPINILVNS
jgi:hypothetical protein